MLCVAMFSFGELCSSSCVLSGLLVFCLDCCPAAMQL